jgi:SET domain-containing protein
MAAAKNKFKPGRYKLRVARAKAGRGLFAMEDIPRGACIIEYVGRPLGLEEMAKDEGKYYFWVSDFAMIDGNMKENTARYINHSCAPNCEVDGPDGRIFVMARRRIRAGEELSYDYGDEYFNKHIKPKGCLCAKCAPRKKALQ